MTSSPEVVYKPCPCPHRILEDIGRGFINAPFGAGLYYFTKGINSPPHCQPIFNGLNAIRMNVPRVCGRIALWRGLLSACECSMLYVRQKDDPWNSIISGAVTGGLLAVRSRIGFTSGAVLGGCLLALIEFAEIKVNRDLNKRLLPLFEEDAGKT